MRLAVCDDDPREQEQFEKALREWDPACKTEKFLNGPSLLEAARKAPSFDVVFLDIYMPVENGVEIATALKHISPETAIVFVTTSEDHAVSAFSLGALHYLVKPVTAQGLAEAFQRLAYVRSRQLETLTFSVKGHICTVLLSQICSLESSNHIVELSLDDGRQLKTRTPLYELEQKLGRRFLRINRGVIVNMDQIERMGTDCCILRTGRQLFLAARERNAIRAAYSDYLMDRRPHPAGEVGS